MTRYQIIGRSADDWVFPVARSVRYWLSFFRTDNKEEQPKGQDVSDLMTAYFTRHFDLGLRQDALTFSLLVDPVRNYGRL
ncbi:hypothetical protein LIA77_11370 [Sarocladium implicatum]|nr:hypothetical protein LIA77_11370 [Sarocladium implicatum]